MTLWLGIALYLAGAVFGAFLVLCAEGCRHQNEIKTAEAVINARLLALRVERELRNGH